MSLSDPRRKKSGESRRARKPDRRSPETEEEKSVQVVPVESEEEEGSEEQGKEEAPDTDTEREGLEKRLQQEENKRKELEDRLLSLKAEFDNYRKRQARDFRRLCSEGKKQIIAELLGVLDNADRAQRLRDDGHDPQEILAGTFQTFSQLRDTLHREGLEKIKVGESDRFDPNIHEAMVAEDVEGVEHDVVLEVLQDGYMLEQELLRPTRVKVGRAVHDDQSGEREEDSEEEAEE
ncbi:nucleotide exchange factor GrpE [Candidatus Fermentibacteria bacterium]|nr:nucleotide exchange factor GrpE [Candidatus Fermentibacteria bacterium]